MKITKQYLKQVIKEEIEKVFEMRIPPLTEPEKGANARIGLDAAQEVRKWNMGKVEYLQRNPEKYEEFAAAADREGLINPEDSRLFKDKEEFIEAVKQGTRHGGTLSNLGNKLLRTPGFPSDKFFDAYASIFDKSHRRSTPDDEKTMNNLSRRLRGDLQEGQTKTVQGVIDDLEKLEKA